MRKFKVVKLISMVIIANIIILFCSCSSSEKSNNKFITTDGGQSYQKISEDGRSKVYSVDNIIYSVPIAWNHKNDGFTGFFHYSQDGGILYVMSSNWAPVEMWDEDTAYKIIYRSIDDMEKIIGIRDIINLEKNCFNNKFSIEFDFSIDFADFSAKGYSLLFVIESYLYKFIFIYPAGVQDCELQKHKNMIIESII